MAVLRFIASLLLLAAAIAFAADLTPLIYGAGGMQATSFSAHWEQLAPATLTGARNLMTGSWLSLLWTYGLEPLIMLPSYILFGILAAIFGYLGRRRRQVQIYIN